MKKILIIFLVIQATQWSFSQQIDMIDMAQTTPTQRQKVKGIYFLHPDFKSRNAVYITKFQFVQEAQIPEKKTPYNLPQIFTAIQRLANKHQGNAFKLISHKVNDQTRTISSLYLEIYRVQEADLQANLQLIPQNKVFIVGSLHKANKRKVKVNKQKIWVAPFTCMELQTPPGNYIKINIGGMFGQTGLIKSRAGKPSQFYSLSNFGMMPGTFANGRVGVKVNTGRFYPIEPSYGYFLSLILPKHQLNL